MNLLTYVANYSACGLESVNFLPRLSAFADSPPFLYHYNDLSHPFLPSGLLHLTLSRLLLSLCKSHCRTLLLSSIFAFIPHYTWQPPFGIQPQPHNPHLVSLNLFPSLHVGAIPRCDLGDISTVTPVMLHRGKHCPPCVTQGTEVPLVWTLIQMEGWRGISH